jgi:hypothetical protein
LVRSFAQHFTDLVIIAERIEQAIGLGKIVDPTKEKGFKGKKKETEIHNTEYGYKDKRNNYQEHLTFL